MEPLKRQVVVVDTSILYSEPQPYTIPELQDIGSCAFVIPAPVLWELDRLMERPDRRDRVRAALNTLKAFVQRGACNSPVSCGEGRTLYIGAVEQIGAHPQIDMTLADDRVLATCLWFANEGASVTLATAEFALHAKAMSFGIPSVYLERYAEARGVVTRRERIEFASRWRRVELADSIWAMCRRGLMFLQARLVRGVLQPVIDGGQPKYLSETIQKFSALSERWTEHVDLVSIFADVFGLAPPSQPDYTVRNMPVPGKPWALGVTYQETLTSYRAESDDERALRIQHEERLRREREEYLMDVILSYLEVVREYVLDQVGDETLE